MNKDLKIIKEKYGENMSKLCRVLFSTLLEKEGLLPKLLISNFDAHHLLFEDLVENNIIEVFKNYIYSLVDVETQEKEIIIKTPYQLLSEAGYDLYECKTENDIQSFKKYYANGEELCTFKDSRLKGYYVFFAVKKNVEQIKRENYPIPRRQDEYGTSVISIQFTKNNSHTLSIKNRYNHKVNNPDATFSNNLDNIINGLTKSFEREYGLTQEHVNKFEIPGYVRAKDGKYYKYNYEINNIYYCSNNKIIENFEVKELNSFENILIDYFIINLKEKTIRLYDKELEDSFINSIGKIGKISITKEQEKKIIRITPDEGEDVIIEINKENKIMGLTNNNVTKIGDDFLSWNKSLTKLNVPQLKY